MPLYNSYPGPSEPAYLDEDDVDIILSSEASSFGSEEPFFELQSQPSPDSHALDSMDEDDQSSRYSFGDHLSSDFSDEDAVYIGTRNRSRTVGDPPEFSPIAPSLSFTSASTNSSIISLSMLPPPATVDMSRQPSRTDKAVAALSLALANGAAGLHDYHDLLYGQDQRPETQAGALWQ